MLSSPHLEAQCSSLHLRGRFAAGSACLGNPILLKENKASVSLHQYQDDDCDIYLNPASIVCCVLRPSSFSSRLIRVAAAERPMTRAKIGSPIFDMRCVGEGMLDLLMSSC